MTGLFGMLSALSGKNFNTQVSWCVWLYIPYSGYILRVALFVATKLYHANSRLNIVKWVRLTGAFL